MTADGARLAGRVAVVTGATGGIGSAICRRLAENGAAVVVGFRRDENAARALVSSLAAVAANPHSAIRVDVTDGSALESFAGQISARYGRADILVNCVGTTRFVSHADLNRLDDDLIDEIFRTNWRGPFATIRALRPLLEKGVREPFSGGSRENGSRTPFSTPFSSSGRKARIVANGPRQFVRKISSIRSSSRRSRSACDTKRVVPTAFTRMSARP